MAGSRMQLWIDLFGEEHGPMLGLAVEAIGQVDDRDFVRIQGQLTRVESLGPILDPSKWTDGKRFHNAALLIQLIRAMRDLATAGQNLRESWQPVENDR